ncbi:MAG: exodeoxyribonuclease VII large subunit, partial [Caldilineaceae bacterium]|nr:exodeoxyribonuclease VII large subunit [Caldilineaceae bacterium]
TPITISYLTGHIKTLLETDDLLRDVWVTGEVSSWKRAASGHVYFTLKDSGATVNAVMWRNSTVQHTWLPSTGDQILAHGYVGIYPERGAYQLYVNRIQPAGRGQLYAQFEALKARLDAAGLFDMERKRPIVPAPARLGVVTSADAAALRDVLRVLSARWPMVEVVVFPTLVQGADAPPQIVAALDAANRYSVEVAPLATILLVRGGGSIEDLWAFNDERVAYAVAASAIPVISGVGHETDFTIADFVADLRMATPSAAAAAAVPDRMEHIEQLRALRRGMAQRAAQEIGVEARHLAHLRGRLARVHPQRQLDQRRQLLDARRERLHGTARGRLDRRREQVRAARLRLGALSPLAVLNRGYSIVQKADGTVVMGPDESGTGETLTVRAAHGAYTVTRAVS